MNNNNNNNQGNYQQYTTRLPPPPSFQQPGASSYVQPRPGPGPGSGTMTSGQSYVSWSQGQRMPPPPLVPPPGHFQTPRIPPPGQHFYRVPSVPPPLVPPPSSSYFTPARSGSYVLPPPPPPSSPPPGPPPLPPSSPALNGNVHVHVNGLSDVPPPAPRDENTVRKIEVLCQYIAKNGEGFEEMTRQKEVGNPEFEFLFGGATGSEAAISHEYFKWMKRKCRSSGLLEGGNNMDLSSKPSVVGTSREDVSHSPAGSDMDMEDDITLPEEKHDAAAISNDVDTKAENIACESPRAIEQGPNISLNDTQLENTKMKDGVADSKLSLDRNTEQDGVNLYKETNQSEQSPFKLIQGYASDDNSENDNDLHFENLSPVAVTPQVKEHTTLSVPVVGGSLDITSKVSEPSIETEKLENRTDGGASMKQNYNLEGDGSNVPKNGGAQKENNNVKLETDKFGRLVKRGGSDSDSDSDDYSTRRRVKRGRSRSRSRSPYGRRSPRRRRRSPSRSWSPRKRGRSRSPNNRKNRSHVQEVCYDFLRGKCFRGAACRYLHKDKSEESRRHKNKQYNHEVSDRLKDSDKSVPVKDEVSHHVSRSSERFNEELVEPPSHSADVTSGHETEHPATEMPIRGQIPISGHSINQTSQPEPQQANAYNLMPSATSWNTLPPPPPRPQLGRPVPQYQLTQPPFQTNYPFQPFVTPYGPEPTSHVGVYPMNNYPILQQPVGPAVINQENFPRTSSPNLVSSNTREQPTGVNAVQSFLQNPVADNLSDFGRSRIMSHYNPYASTFDQPLSTKFSSGVFNQDYSTSTNQTNTLGEGQTHNFAPNPPMSGGDQYDPLFDSVDPSSNSVKKSNTIAASEENDGFGETADAEVGAVENDSPSPSSPIDLPDMTAGDIEIDQVKNKKSKDSRSMKLFKIALADFVKEVLKPSWRQGNMSKEAFKTIVKKTVDKVSGAMKKHQIPKSQSKINHYIDSSQRKLTKLVMGYVDKYVKV
ncbi:hypothetical protein M8C21_022313 [Ambrosia artemisiifolia]|uniref:Uncharacterized protein n=1 Tax=Ambrosia artemisiifolia TaxID=4212 RepID=A0AAD5GEP2_AMBAR|nr:hypothetical protein M8C21_022313 [Ambrosia artemisiifolia]